MLSIEKQLLFLLSRSTGMESQELIRIYEHRGYSAAYIRNGLSRLKKEGYAVSPSRSSYQITESGRAFIYSINQKPLLYSRTWDGNWHLVMLEIPESERKKRDQFRADILQTGFGLLYNSVYIAPWSYSQEITQLIEKYELHGRVTQFQGTIQGKSLTPNDAVSLWGLEQVAGIYQDKRSWFHQEFEPRMDAALRHSDQLLELFVCYLHLGEVISELYLADPMLPEELLPEGWEGRTILQTFLGHMDRLTRAIPENSLYAQFVRS
ncbi:PaaX family transcriptional regulator C-terminal domain-containing protein [Paenibacillus hexagrammi]|uniref:PaaX family transcriptional regulator n=1 Tax=Paenibacillus hexagrammi TaxID=2908839 RepID=A0ABY3SIB4_9BACL|nr:PaaX family transcriptional regulator C-terminal domain-containing protein [Paenibacillus sp. YPD9-1]UJF33469.1 PaaX family transcriptional regulator [Paenibacillus sp. YPD9-1]